MAASPDNTALTNRPVIVVLTTGGTISSVTDPQAGRVPQRSGGALTTGLPDFNDFDVQSVSVFARSSFALTATHFEQLQRAVAEQLDNPRVAGVVITHGTDTLEESAYLLYLLHGDTRPVVVTGAIRPADDSDPDGPANLRDAVSVAASASARNRGVLVVFGGQIFSAAGARKVDTTASAAFDSPDVGPVGSIHGGRPHFVHRAPSAPPTPAVTGRTDPRPVRVDIVATYPGADDVALRAHAGVGAHGIVLEALGSGNTPPSLASAVTELSSAGVIVVVSSRVYRGPIAALYGGPGGGCELAAVGAIHAGWLHPSQARVALLALLANDDDHRTVRDAFITLAAKH